MWANEYVLLGSIYELRLQIFRNFDPLPPPVCMGIALTILPTGLLGLQPLDSPPLTGNSLEEYVIFYPIISIQSPTLHCSNVAVGDPLLIKEIQLISVRISESENNILPE